MCDNKHDLVDLYCKPKDHNIPMLQKIGINLTKFTPDFILENITKNVCSSWITGGKDEILKYIRLWKIAWKECKKCVNDKTDEQCAKRFSTKNEFFQRELHPKYIKIDNKEQKNVLVSPADCRMVAYDNVCESKTYWIKGQNFSKKKLLKSESLAKKFRGPIIICRLAPDDYHRFHFPVDCTYVKGYKISGKYNSVDRRIVNSCIDSFGENKREVHLIYNKYFGYIAYVIIGATCVGSIETNNLLPNKKYKKGDLFGMFGFGGSSIVMLFAKDFDIRNILLENSKNSIETYVRVGNYLGKIKKQLHTLNKF